MDSIANGVFGFLQRPRVARHAKEAVLVAANLDAPPMYRFGACANWRHAHDAWQYTVSDYIDCSACVISAACTRIPCG
jgi:hypothetical protein